MKPLRLSPLVAAAALALAAGTANAWTAAGDAQAFDGRLTLTNAYADGSDDADGVDRNVTGHDPLLADVGAGGLEDAVGVASGALDPRGTFGGEGSALTETFVAAAGSRLSFSWNLSTMATSGAADFADIAFVVVDGRIVTLASALDATAAGSGGWAAQTGWSDWWTTLDATADGRHTISLGVLDVGDTAESSALDVTAFAVGAVSAVPENAPLVLMAAGLGLLGLARRRRG